MNNDLISRSALLELAHNHVGGTVDCNDIARFPAVDAEVVRHGRWIPCYEPVEVFVDVMCNTEIIDTQTGWICSECGRHGYGKTLKEMPYCHCGAKMEEKIIKEDKFMSTGWNSQQGEGKFAIQFETTHKDLYKLVEKACQNAMDEADARKSAKSGCFKNGNNHNSNREMLGDCHAAE